MCRPGESETSFTGKLIASLTICQSTSSGTSGVANGSTAPRSEVSGALRDVLYLNEFRSSRTSHFVLNHFQKRGSVQRSIAQCGDLQGAMRERFIALTPRCNQRRVTTRHRVAWFFAWFWLKRATPQHGLWIVQISFDEQQLLFRGSRQMHDRHLAPQAHEQIVPGVNDASR